jgi:hypothetical protein
MREVDADESFERLSSYRGDLKYRTILPMDRDETFQRRRIKFLEVSIKPTPFSTNGP